MGPFEKRVFEDTCNELQKDEHHEPFGYAPVSVFANARDRSMSEETGKKILDKLDSLERRLDLMFGDSVLIAGRWVSIQSFKRVGR